MVFLVALSTGPSINFGAIPNIMQAASRASFIGAGGVLKDFIMTKSFTFKVLNAFSAASNKGYASLSLS